MSILGRSTRNALIFLASIPLVAAAGQAQANGKQQVLMLPDPTPREPDLEQKYNQAPVDAAATDHAVLVLDQERHTLIERAAKQLAQLATVLNDAILKHQTGTSLAPEVQVADLIEKLAKNVNAAVKLSSQSQKPVQTAKPETASNEAGAEEMQLQQQAGKLLLVVQQLQAEVGKSDPGTLSLGVLAKSAEVERQAKALKQQLKKNTAG